MDAIVIGSGPNGLTAAATLTRHGWRVLVLEARQRPGGAVWSEPFTLPGYLHDVGAAFFPFADYSPAFRFLDLAGAGLQWANAEWESCHPAPDGTSATIGRDAQLSARTFGPDGPRWQQLANWQKRMGARLPEALLAPLPNLRTAWNLGLANLVGLGWNGLTSTGHFARRNFRSEAARRVIPGLALHVDLGPEDPVGTGLGLVLGLLAADSGFKIPLGGAKAITLALIKRLEGAGGQLRLGTHVRRILVRGRRAVAVQTDAGEEIPFRHAVLANVTAPALFCRLLDRPAVGGWLQDRMQRFRFGWGTFKMDWALSGPVPWTVPEARSAAVVHAGDSIEDLTRFTRQVRAGHLPDNPYLVIGQQSLADPGRAPPGRHTLWAYSRVPSRLAESWASQREAFADRIEQRLEGLAPGFRSLILGRYIAAPPDLEAMDENLTGGDLGGGSAHLDQQLFLRPAFPHFRHRTPVKGVYLASASCHPGAGVHGACGFNAAHMALLDAGVKPLR
jgi:phytoene dehydrogenase-like protein